MPDSESSVTGKPTPLIEWAAEVEKGMAGDLLGKRVLAYDAIASTNDELKRRAMTGAIEGLTIIANQQTAGKGRHGRSWVSPKGKGLYMSVLLRPELSSDEVGWLAIMAGVAVAEMLERQDLGNVQIKWPNDVLVAGKKIAGVLVEPRVGDGLIDFAVVGIGLNLLHEDADWVGTPAEGHATSCKLEGINLNASAATVAILKVLNRLYEAVQSDARNVILDEWAKRGGRREVPPVQ